MTHHKLIHATSEKVLTDTKTVLEENIQDRGKIVLFLSPAWKRETEFQFVTFYLAALCFDVGN